LPDFAVRDGLDAVVEIGFVQPLKPLASRRGVKTLAVK
jgi:hypothetical protein